MPQLPLAEQAYEASDRDVANQRLINMFVEAAPENASVPFYIRATPGLTSFATMGVGPIRGAREMANVLYVVSGGQFFSVDSSGTVTEISGNISGNGPVTLESNNTQTQLGITAEPDIYTFTVGGGLVQVTDPDAPAASSMTFLDGYGIFSVRDSNQFALSALNDFSDFDALDFASAESDSDLVVRVVAEKRELFVMGEKTTERWFNSGASPFPFERVASPSARAGIRNKDAVTRIDNTIYWLDERLIVRRLENSIPVRVSTHAIERKIASYADTTATAGSFTLEGHNFVVWNFTEGCWAFDINTQRWHQLKSDAIDTWRVQVIFTAFDKVYGGDSTNGNVYEISFNVLDEAGIKRPSLFTLPSVGNGEVDTIMGHLAVEFETGVGLSTGQGSAPEAMLRFSDDGGRTWSNERRRSLGALGDYDKTVRWNRMGKFSRRVYELSVSDPVVKRVMAAYGR